MLSLYIEFYAESVYLVLCMCHWSQFYLGLCVIGHSFILGLMLKLYIESCAESVYLVLCSFCILSLVLSLYVESCAESVH